MENNIENYTNECFCMDNLELMKELPSDSIDLIYCDILYNTGKKFKDYDDRLGTPQEAMEWYKPRLIEMKRILKNTGSIYLQCDYRLVHYLKVEMDKVFGIENFRNDIVWSYGGQSRANDISSKHDNILRYSKSKIFIYNTQYKPYSERSLKEFRHKNDKGQKCVRTCRRDKNGNKVYYYTPIGEGACITDVWDIGNLTPSSKERVGYDTQKPRTLIERIIKASSNEGDIVADFFCGSGTTGVVAKELNRKYILCDINPRAIEISEKRLAECEVDKSNTDLKNK